MLSVNHRIKATLIILGLMLCQITSVVSAQETITNPWWNPLGIGMGSSTTTSSSKYADFSGSPMTPAPDTSMPKMDSGTSSSWEWPSLPKPQWKAPSLSWPKLSTPSWMKPSTKSSTSSSSGSWSRSTKRWWKNTTKMLNPFPSDNNGVVSSRDSFSSGYSSGSSSSTSSSSSWNIFSWWDQPEEKKLQTPNDFFSLPKP